MPSRWSSVAKQPANDSIFTIRIESDEFPQYSVADVVERAPYRIEAQFDGNATVEANVNGTSDESTIQSYA
jgi:hypothetical protein